MVVVWTATVLAGPYLVQFGIDQGITDRDAGALNLAVAGYVVVADPRLPHEPACRSR